MLLKSYCLGFIFDPSGEKVLLLKKRSTDRWNANLWNGVGGSVEEGETSLQAMVRETLEEANVLTREDDWELLGKMSDEKYFVIDVFCTYQSLIGVKSLTDEPVQEFNRKDFGQLSLAAFADFYLKKWQQEGTVATGDFLL